LLKTLGILRDSFKRRLGMELLPSRGADGPMPVRDDDAIDVLAVVGVLRRKKWFILAIAAAGGQTDDSEVADRGDH
jgi:hypothetical protein